MLKSGYIREKVRHVFIFVDGLLLLPTKTEIQFKKEVQNLSGENEKMGLTAEMSNIGQIAFKGGEIKGEKSLLIRLIERKWGKIQLSPYQISLTPPQPQKTKIEKQKLKLLKQQ